jgi:hypothetical protein
MVRMFVVAMVASCAVAPLFPSLAMAADDAWYFARRGAERCVAIDNVDVETNARLRDHSGEMEEPADVRDAFTEAGIPVTEKRLKPDLVELKVAPPGKRPIRLLHIKGGGLCHFLMREPKPK